MRRSPHEHLPRRLPQRVRLAAAVGMSSATKPGRTADHRQQAVARGHREAGGRCDSHERSGQRPAASRGPQPPMLSGTLMPASWTTPRVTRTPSAAGDVEGAAHHDRQRHEGEQRHGRPAPHARPVCSGQPLHRTTDHETGGDGTDQGAPGVHRMALDEQHHRRRHEQDPEPGDAFGRDGHGTRHPPPRGVDALSPGPPRVAGYATREHGVQRARPVALDQGLSAPQRTTPTRARRPASVRTAPRSPLLRGPVRPRSATGRGRRVRAGRQLSRIALPARRGARR